MRISTTRSVRVLAVGAMLAGAARLDARTVTIDEADAGTVRDGLVDGFPGLAPMDGVADFAGNPLGVALKSGVTEERALVEFPLAKLAGVPADHITAATLTFNVDDVLSTFGPGTEFSGRAASTILVHLYDGDGAVKLADFRETAEAPFTVTTGPGSITDASLDRTGAIRFVLDVRARLARALATGSSFLGVLWRTTDSPTGTSLDNLGEGSGGPPGARGSRLPFLTVDVQDTPSSCEEGAACDDGDPCTTGDVCLGGVCRGTSPCGNGRIDASCGEECDDGNRAPADGCSPECRFDTLPGGRGRRACLLEIAFAAPVRLPDGTVAPIQVCRDNDPHCDEDPRAGVCGFVLAACLGRADPRVPACAAVAAVSATVTRPGRAVSASDRRNRERLEAMLAAAPIGGCAPPVRIEVPLRRRGKAPRAGTTSIALRASAPGVGRDRDAVRLVCRPPS